MRRAVGLALLAGAVLMAGEARAAQDDRGWQHGISFVDLPDHSYEVFWSAQGNPPSPPPVHWTHDIYFWHVDPAKPSIDANAAKTIIANPEAQEPVSAAMSADGHIMLVTEDGFDSPKTVCERYGVYDAQLRPIKPYPQMIVDGAHSAHVAAVQNRFVVFYSDQWIEGGGVDNLGSGKDVLAAIYDTKGDPIAPSVNLTADPKFRDWWPVVAGSQTRACLVWQRYVEGQTYAHLMMAVIDPATGALVSPPKQIDTTIEYYHYSVSYLPAVDRFLVRGTYKGAKTGFGHLLDEEGKTIASSRSLPAIVRESQSIVRNDPGAALVVQPMLPTGLSVLRVTPASLREEPSIKDDYIWDYSGIDGRFVDTNRVFVAALSTNGMWTKSYDGVALDAPSASTPTGGVVRATPPTRAGACGCAIVGDTHRSPAFGALAALVSIALSLVIVVRRRFTH